MRISFTHYDSRTKSKWICEAQAPLEPALTIAEAQGCDHCAHTGYRGRMAVTEILRITPKMEEMIAADAPRAVLRKQALGENFRSMAADGIEKVLRHETSLDELRRGVDLTRAD